MRETVGRRAQGQDQRTPEDVQCGEHQERDGAADLQHAVPAQQQEHRSQQGAIRHAGPGGIEPGQSSPHQDGERQHGRGGAEVHAAPARQVADRAGQYARQEQADEYPSLGCADDAPALVGSRRAGGIGDQSLRHRGAEQAGQEHGCQQHARRPGTGDRNERQGQEQQLHQHQAPALGHVPQGHQQDQRQGAAGLRRRKDSADRRMGDRKIDRHGVQQRLGVIHVRHAHACRTGEQPGHAGRYDGLRSSRPCVGWCFFGTGDPHGTPQLVSI